MRVQGRLDDAAGRIDALVARDGLAGYSGLVVSAATHELTLYWQGTVPPALQRLTASLAAPEVRVVTRQAPYSKAQLQQAVRTIAGDPHAADAGVVQVSPRPDGTGITVGVNAPALEAARTRLLAVDVPVFLERRGYGTPMAGRWDDISPYWGGSVIVNVSGTDTYPCSAGWPMHCPEDGDLARHLILTADHCGFGSYETPTGREVGVAFGEHGDLEHDTRMVDTNFLGEGGQFSGDAIYTGTVGPNGGDTKVAAWSIRGARAPQVGDIVYTSGGFSGERSSIRVTNTDATTLPAGPTGVVHSHMVEAEQIEQTTAVGEGDSGGPVYVYGEDGGVIALGTISIADSDTPTQCAGVFAYKNQVRRCFWRMWFSNIEIARAHYGAEVNVWSDQVTTRSGRPTVGAAAGQVSRRWP